MIGRLVNSFSRIRKKEMHHMARRKTVLLAAAVVSAGALFSMALAAEKAPARRDRQSWPGASVTVKPGQAAPDVELWPLTMATDANGQEVARVGDKKVKLSDYKGKAPLVIFSSSYT